MNALAYRRRAASDGGGESADKAFWISFADMMTALMVLFLMVMAVALLAITQRQPPQPTPPVEVVKPQPPSAAEPESTPPVKTETPPEPVPADAQSRAVDLLMQQIAAAVEGTPGVQLDTRRHVIDFGDRARFMTGSHRLDTASAQLLRRFVPQLLAITQTTLGKRWIHRVVVEGFADPRGDYLYNLNLSLQRGQRVLCALLDRAEDGSVLSDTQRAEVRDIFAVGGFSFNDQRESLDASRRIELRIEFGPRPPVPATAQAVGFGTCRLAP
jgi:outer membrane protein OmpA-like peptidoglycan-associated protein